MRAALVGNQQLAEFSRQIGAWLFDIISRGEIDGVAASVLRYSVLV